MAVNRNSSMTDFLVTFFIENYTTTIMLSDAVKKRGDRSLANTLGLPDDFVFPFFLEENEDSIVYTVKIDRSSKYQASIMGKPCYSHTIKSGDYISFACDSAGFKMLFIASEDISLGYKKYQIERNTNIFIGRTPLNDISCSISDYISRDKHVVIRIDNTGNAYIEDLKRTVGIYVNGKITHSQHLQKYDEIFLMGLSIIYMGDFIAVNKYKVECSLHDVCGFEAKELVDNTKQEKYFVSTPRILKSLEYEEIEVDAPPAAPVIDKTPAILLLGPSITMSIVMLASISVSIFSAINGGNMTTIIASAAMAIGMLLGSLLWPSLLRSYQKKQVLAEQKYRKDKYSEYISDIEENLIAKTARSSQLLNESLNPSPDVMCSFLDDESKKLHLWERSSEDVDFLDVRVGVGNKKFDAVSLKTPRKGFQLHDDELRELPYALEKKYGTLKNVPLTLNLSHNHTIGIIGNSECTLKVINEIILNIISLHSYEEDKLVLAVSPKQKNEFEKFKNIPHIWSDDKKIRYYATDSDEVHYIFNIIDEILTVRESSDAKDIVPIPHYCIIVTDPALIEKEALFRFMEDAENNVGLTTVFAYGDITKLPKSCKAIIQSDEERTGFYIKNKNANRFIPFKLDILNEDKIVRFADALSHLPIKRNQRSLGIIDKISFLQMYKAGNVDELEIEKHWDSNNSAKSLAAPIGVMAGGDVFNLDIHEAYHGCHGLVAGTTGSGKSEFLQAFILSLAINYSPKEVSFVLVDFKGGDMARPFMAKAFSPALPHLAATISNLSGNILYRALVSLDAEIKYRQRIFNESAAELQVDKLDINSYHKYYKGGRLSKPLPHLVIIIDEFAQLKTQQPEFLTQLINVAQVGRSLGIHLILATQKPSGIVDPQIMSNSRFKVCLKVAEKQDSVDMINRPDSAMIKNPGRLNLLVGYNEIYECVQSGYSGADYVPTDTFISDDEITVQMTDNTANPIHSARIDMSGNKSDKTQIEAIVAEIVRLGQKKHLQVKPLWLDTLSDRISLSSLKKSNRGLCTATVGLVDFIKSQKQEPLHIDFLQTGHIALYGAGGTGKTTFLQTLVYSMVSCYQYSPSELNIYALDFGGRNLNYLESLPHVGGVVFSGEDQKISDLVNVLGNLIEERKRLFSSNNCGSFAEYRTSVKSPLPAILVEPPLSGGFFLHYTLCAGDCQPFPPPQLKIPRLTAPAKSATIVYINSPFGRFFMPAHEILFCFDTEDFTSCRSADAIRDSARLLESEGVRGNYFIVGWVAKQLLAWKRTDVLDALAAHEIQFHSLSHSHHPTLAEYTDIADADEAFLRVLAEESEGIGMVKAACGRDRILAAVPAGDSLSWAAMYAYAALGLPAYCDSDLMDLGGQPYYYAGALHIAYKVAMEDWFFDGGYGEGWSTYDEDELIAFLESRPTTIVYTHPHIILNEEHWDSVNYKGENTHPWGEWEEAPARPAAATEWFYRCFRSLVRRLKSEKNDDGSPKFVIRTVSEAVEAHKTSRTVLREHLPVYRDALRAAFSENRFDPLVLSRTAAPSVSLSELLYCAAKFAQGADEVPLDGVLTCGFLEMPKGTDVPLTLSAEEVRSLLKGLTFPKGFGTPVYLPSSLTLDGRTVGPADLLLAALDILTGSETAEVLPKPQQPSLDLLPDIRDLNLEGQWVFSPDFHDDYLSKRLRLQFWTMRL